jgi:hypothetical protein
MDFTTERANGNLHHPLRSWVDGGCNLRGVLVLAGVVILMAGFALGGYGSLPRTQSVTETQPVQVPRSTEWQVEWRTFTPEGLWGATVGTDHFPSTFKFDWGNGVLFGEYSDWIGFSATATVVAPRSGPVTFTIGSDDGSRLLVDGNEAIDLWSDHYYTTQSAIVDLTEGQHLLVFWYYERTGLAQVSFSAPSDILSWQETRYQVVTKEVTVLDATLQSVGIGVGLVGIPIAAIGAASRRKVLANKG